jgi:hypothetical protein
VRFGCSLLGKMSSLLCHRCAIVVKTKQSTKKVPMSASLVDFESSLPPFTYLSDDSSRCKWGSRMRLLLLKHDNQKSNRGVFHRNSPPALKPYDCLYPALKSRSRHVKLSNYNDDEAFAPTTAFTAWFLFCFCCVLVSAHILVSATPPDGDSIYENLLRHVRQRIWQRW